MYGNKLQTVGKSFRMFGRRHRYGARRFSERVSRDSGWAERRVLLNAQAEIRGPDQNAIRHTDFKPKSQIPANRKKGVKLRLSTIPNLVKDLAKEKLATLGNIAALSAPAMKRYPSLYVELYWENHFR